MKQYCPKSAILASAFFLAFATSSPAEEIIFNATFDDVPLGTPSLTPNGLPEFDSFAFGLGDYAISNNPDGSSQQCLEGISFFDEDSFIALADPTFDSSLSTDGLFEISWTSAVGPNTSATISVSNGDSTSAFVTYDAPSGQIKVNGADGLAVSTDPPVSFTPEQSQSFLLSIDFASETFDLNIDGILVGTELPLIGNSTKGLTDIEFRYSYHPSASSGLFPFPSNELPVGIIRADTIQIKSIPTNTTVEAIFELYPNPASLIKNKSIHRAIPAVIFGSDALDISKIQVESLRLNGSPVKQTRNHSLVQSIDIGGPNGKPDGYPDLLCKFTQSEDENDLHTLEGELENGDLIHGLQAR